MIDVFARWIVGWRALASLRTDLALERTRAGHLRPVRHATGDLVHHSDRGTQYLYTERLADASIELSVGSGGDAYDNALAEAVIGLFKTEVIRRRGPVAQSGDRGIRNA